MVEQFLKWVIGQIDYRFYVPLIIDFFKGLLWPVIILCLAFIFKKQIAIRIEKLESFEGFGAKIKWGSEGEDAAPSLTKIRTKQGKIDGLALLLFKYQFVWGAWGMGSDFCHAVRFSEKYSGGTLHYIDELARDLDLFIKDKNSSLSININQKLKELSFYINGVLPYHEKQERLSRPVFSIPQYQTLLRSLANEIDTAA